MSKEQSGTAGGFAAAAQQGELEVNKFHMGKILGLKPTTVPKFYGEVAEITHRFLV